MTVKTTLDRQPSSSVPFVPSLNAPKSDVENAIRFVADAAASAADVASGALVAANNLSDLVDDATARGNLGLGTSAVKDIPSSGNASISQVVFGTDTRLTNARTPTAHAASHASGGTDPLAAVATSGSAADLGTGTLPAARLPNPAATTLGGVKSLAATSHQFLTSITTAGLPVAAQPAAGDISGLAAVATSGSATDLTTGTLPAARLPTPTASVLGGVKSLAAVSHKFITSIGTDGTPVAAQPAFSDLSGSAAAAQLPLFTNLANGAVPASGGGTTNFLRADGSFAAPSGASDFTADSGSGGAHGLVPAPAAGDAAKGKVLCADGTWTNRALVFVQEITMSSVSSQSIAVPAGCQELLIKLNGVSLSTSGAQLQLQISIAGSTKSGASDYQWGINGTTNTTANQSGSTAATSIILMFGNGTINTLGGEIEIRQPLSTSFKKGIAFDIYTTGTAMNQARGAGHYNGTGAASSAFDAAVLSLTGGGTMSGSLRAYMYIGS